VDDHDLAMDLPFYNNPRRRKRKKEKEKEL